jgi:hypothetical protein
MKLIHTSLPSGVQRALTVLCGACPVRLPQKAHTAIMALWERRNKCDESEVDAINRREDGGE